MKLPWLAIGSLMAVAPLCSWACIPIAPSADEAHKASFIVEGKAVGMRFDEPPTLFIGVAVGKVVKGKAPEILEAMSPCALPIHNGEDVFVLNIGGESWVYPTEIYGEAIRSALRD